MLVLVCPLDCEPYEDDGRISFLKIRIQEN